MYEYNRLLDFAGLDWLKYASLLTLAPCSLDLLASGLAKTDFNTSSALWARAETLGDREQKDNDTS